MKLFLRVLKWTGLGISSILLAGFLYLYFIYFGRPDEVVKVDEVNDTKWHTIPLKGSTMCSDGSEFVMYVRKGTSSNVIIYFSGGGACWDDSTCGQPISLLSAFDGDSRDLKSFYLPSLMRFFPKAIGGMADTGNPQNAFRDWNFVFIPYCTGDLHIGHTTNAYTFNGKKLNIHHNGRNNSLAALNWVFANFKEADKLMVAGESAGAYGSAFWAPYIADHYAGKKIYQLSDGAALASNRWKEILDTVWQSQSKDFLHLRIGKDIFEDALIHRADSVKRQIKYLHSNTLYDDVLTRFGAKLNHSSTHSNHFIDEWSGNTKAMMKRLTQANIDYHYFITDSGYDPTRHATQHTMTTNELYYTNKADGISFAEWLKRNVIDEENLSLGEKLLEK
ncbi:MAG TPA: pectin acetylesterase-family hydrolase [Emticicia sp.]